MDTVTMTTASLSQQRGGGSGAGGGEGGGEKRRMRRERETKQRAGGGGGGGELGHPDLDLDLVEEEVREEKRGWQEEERRSQTVRQKEVRDGSREQGSRSRSLPRSSALSLDTSLSEGWDEVEQPGGGAKERKRRNERSEMKSRRSATEANREAEERRKGIERWEDRDDSFNRHAKHSGSSGSAQRAAFSFLRPMDDNEPQHLSDSESEASFSEVSLSAASITTVRQREGSDWRRARSPSDQSEGPGPWLRPSPKRLTQVLRGGRPGGRELVGGLSL